MPETTAKEIIAWLMGKYPNQYVTGQTRTLQRRIAEWRQTQQSLEQNLRTLMLNEKSVLTTNSALTSDFTNNLDCDAEFSEMNKFLT